MTQLICIYFHSYSRGGERISYHHCPYGGWSGDAMVLGKLPVPGRPTILITVGQGPAALAVGAGGGLFDRFYSHLPFSPHSPSLCETARYRLKYCLKGPLNPKQPTNQPFLFSFKLSYELWFQIAQLFL